MVLSCCPPRPPLPPHLSTPPVFAVYIPPTCWFSSCVGVTLFSVAGKILAWWRPVRVAPVCLLTFLIVFVAPSLLLPSWSLSLSTVRTQGGRDAVRADERFSGQVGQERPLRRLQQRQLVCVGLRRLQCTAVKPALHSCQAKGKLETLIGEPTLVSQGFRAEKR